VSRERSALTSSMEDYLEAIYALQRKHEAARVKDIARALGVKMPSVTGALKLLKAKQLVEHERYGRVRLTSRGLAAARQVDRRHRALVEFLTAILKVPPQRAEEEACRLEHAISSETLRRLSCLVNFLRDCPRTGGDWLARLSERLEASRCSASCEQCIEQIALP